MKIWIMTFTICLSLTATAQSSQPAATDKSEATPHAGKPCPTQKSETAPGPSCKVLVNEKPEPAYDPSKWFSLILGAQAGGGFDYHHTPSAQATAKLGSGPLTLDFGYDRLAGHNGFSTELSGMLPVVRFPAPKKDEKKLYLRLYAEPGVGYRAGSGPFGGYTSAKVMIALMSDHWIYRDDNVLPYIEYQHRFPFNSPLHGDDRISIGVMVTICGHCGID